MHVWVSRFSLVLLLVFPCHAVAAQPIGQPADVVFRHGAVYTVDAVRSWAQAVAVSGERIVYVGLDQGVNPWIGDNTVVVDLGGRKGVGWIPQETVDLQTAIAAYTMNGAYWMPRGIVSQ